MRHLRYLLVIVSLLLLVACDTTPFIVPDNTSDNVVMLQIKDEIAQTGAARPSYGWLFWYMPVVILASFWGYREFIRRPLLCEENGETRDEPLKPKETEQPGSPTVS